MDERQATGRRVAAPADDVGLRHAGMPAQAAARGVHVARIDLLLRFHAGVHLRHAVLVGVGHVRLVPVRGLALLELTQALLQSIRTVDYSPG